MYIKPQGLARLINLLAIFSKLPVSFSLLRRLGLLCTGGSCSSRHSRGYSR